MKAVNGNQTNTKIEVFIEVDAAQKNLVTKRIEKLKNTYKNVEFKIKTPNKLKDSKKMEAVIIGIKN